MSPDILMLLCSCRVRDSELATKLHSMVMSKLSAVKFFPSHPSWFYNEKTSCGDVQRGTAFSAFLAFFSQPVKMSGLGWDYCDIKNLQRSLSKHELSTTHIQSQIVLKTFGISRINLALDEQRRLKIRIQ